MAVALTARPTIEAPVARPARPVPPMRTRPIPVAAYPAGTPRWVTYEGRRQRVLAVREQPAFDPAWFPIGASGRRLRVQLAGGRELTLVQDDGAWFQR